MSLAFHVLRVAARQPAADDALVLSFEVPEALRTKFRFEPGQYLTLRRREGEAEQRRAYSICSAPGGPLRVGVRRVRGGEFSNWLHDGLRVGDPIEVMPPQGRFGAQALRYGAGRHLLGIAGGSGITPILSILQAVLADDATSRFTLLYGNRSAASMMFREELQDLKNRHLARLAVHPVFSRESVESPLHAGRLDRDKVGALLRLVDVPRLSEVFVCGPHALNDEAEAALLAAGVAPERIHIERFGVPQTAADAVAQQPQPGDAPTATVAIVRDGMTREVGMRPGDESVLAAAARAALDLPYACRSGVCATCRCKVLEGRVRMDRNFALDQRDLDAGFVLACRAHPLTERVVLSFDER